MEPQTCTPGTDAHLLTLLINRLPHTFWGALGYLPSGDTVGKEYNLHFKGYLCKQSLLS